MTDFRATFNADIEQCKFLDDLPSTLTYSEMAARCLERFGHQRAWADRVIAAYWHHAHPPQTYARSRILRDPELRRFIEDRLGRRTLTELRAECIDHFGAERTPSRSAIHEHWQRLYAPAKEPLPMRRGKRVTKSKR